MSNEINPNVLAWKGTPGPWRFVKQAHATKKSGLGIRYAVAATYKGLPDMMWLYNVPIDKTEDIDVHLEIEANAHMISAAPEAIEFIADLLIWIENTDFTQDEVKEKISRAEEILKKAYNH